MTVQILIDSLGKADASRKRDRNDSDADSDPMEKYTQAARWLAVSIDTFIDLTAVLEAGMKISKRSAADAENHPDHDYFLRVYEQFSKMVPDLAEVTASLHQNPGARQKFIAKIVTAANNARADDTSSLRMNGIPYMCKDPTSQVLPPITKDQGKTVRGFNHPMTARFLCPMRYLKDFDHDPNTMIQKIKDGSLRITGLELPSFLYDESMYDPVEPDKGFLRGYLLVRVYRHIFTGPASALSLNDRRSTKPPKAKMHRLTNVTANTIAYAIVQARFMVSSSGTWSTLDGSFNAKKFFYDIVRLFETDPTDEWCVDTLKWWDTQVPGLWRGTCKAEVQAPTDPTVEEHNDLDDILAMRQKRRCRTTQHTPEINFEKTHKDTAASTSNHENHPQHLKTQDSSATTDALPDLHQHELLDSCSSLSSEDESGGPSKPLEVESEMPKPEKKTTTSARGGKGIKPKRKARK